MEFHSENKRPVTLNSGMGSRSLPLHNQSVNLGEFYTSHYDKLIQELDVLQTAQTP